MTAAPAPDILSLFWSPICAVGSHDGSRLNAQICVSVFGASIVPEQPRLLVCLSKTNYTHELAARTGTLAVTALATGQLHLLEPLGLISGREGDKLGGLPLERTTTGDPWFPGGVGYLGCEVLDDCDLGDATAFLCAVRERRRLDPAGPLTWAQARAVVGDDFLRRWAEKSRLEQAAARATMTWR